MSPVSDCTHTVYEFAFRLRDEPASARGANGTPLAGRDGPLGDRSRHVVQRRAPPIRPQEAIQGSEEFLLLAGRVGIAMRKTPRSILCATDFSPVGNQAVETAFAMAGPGSVVHLLHVSEPALLAGPLDGTVLPLRTALDDPDASERRSLARLQKLIPETASEEGVRTDSHVVHEMDTPAEILSAAKRLAVDVIVLGASGRTGLGRMFMGSVAADVMKRSPVSVILVHNRNNS